MGLDNGPACGGRIADSGEFELDIHLTAVRRRRERIDGEKDGGWQGIEGYKVAYIG